MKSRLPITLLMLVVALRTAAATNQFYVTDEEETHYGNTVTLTREQIEHAMHARDSRPADQDPEGHWGPVSEGFQLSIRFAKDSFTNAEPVLASVIIRNVSDRTLSFPVSFARDDQSDTRIVLSRAGERVYGKNEPKPGATFRERVGALRAGSRSACPSAPGTQRKFLIDLRRFFDLTNGQYTVYAERDVHALTDMHRTKVVSGAATFGISQ